MSLRDIPMVWTLTNVADSSFSFVRMPFTTNCFSYNCRSFASSHSLSSLLFPASVLGALGMAKKRQAKCAIAICSTLNTQKTPTILSKRGSSQSVKHSCPDFVQLQSASTPSHWRTSSTVVLVPVLFELTREELLAPLGALPKEFAAVPAFATTVSSVQTWSRSAAIVPSFIPATAADRSSRNIPTSDSCAATINKRKNE